MLSNTHSGLWRDPRLARWAGWVVAGLSAVLYLLTLDNGLRPDELSGGDLITHQYAQAQARPGNAPGYPLYTMGGWLWFRLTGLLLGWLLNPIQRLSSYSVLWAVLALVVLYHLILLVTRGNWVLAALSTLFYSVNYFFWYYSVTTEQYTSAVFQTLLILYLAFRWEEQVSPAGETGETTQSGVVRQPTSARWPLLRGQKPSDLTLLLLAFVVGTCVANLVTTLFVLPPLVWFILSRRTGLLRRPGMLAVMGAAGLLPMVSYVYVFVRGAAHPEWWGEGHWPNAWSWFVDFLTTQQGRDELLPGLTLDRFFTHEFPSLMWGELTPFVLALGLIGLAWLGRRRAVLVGATIAIYLVFCWLDRFGNWYQVIMPVYPMLVLGLAAVLNGVWERDAASGRFRRLAPYLIVLGLLLLTVYRFGASLPRANQYNRPQDTGLDPGWQVLADFPQEGAVVVADYDEWLALGYLVDVWGAQPQISPRPGCQPGDVRSSLYITRRAAASQPDCLAGRHFYAAGANLIQVQESPEYDLPADAQLVNAGFGARMSLAGYQVERVQESPGYDSSSHVWRLSLFWRAEDVPERDYTVSVRPLLGGVPVARQDGEPIIQDHQPVWNTYPTSRWAPGEVVRDDYVLALPEGIAPDGVEILVYEPTGDGFENLGQARIDLSGLP